jgi:hypothetical protein
LLANSFQQIAKRLAGSSNPDLNKIRGPLDETSNVRFGSKAEKLRVWARQQRPSARTVAAALTLSGHPVHYATVARWKRQDWRPVRSDHPLEVARSQIEAVAPLVTADPETRLDDIIGVPEGKELDQSADGELLRKAARELAIATASSQWQSKTGLPIRILTPWD